MEGGISPHFLKKGMDMMMCNLQKQLSNIPRFLCRFSASCLRNIGATPNYPEPQMENGAETHTRAILEIHSRCEESSYGGNCSGETKEQRGDKLYTVSFRSQFSVRVLRKTTEEPWMQGSRHTLPQEAWIYMTIDVQPPEAAQ